MTAVTLALIGFFSFLMIRVTTPQMVPLFTDLSMDDSSAIIKDLDRQGITYELKNGGAIIMVPQDKVARLRMKLAENGLPKGGGVGYEIFDKSDALGATSFIQNINKLRALEGELARTIRSINRVEAARVHLVLPDRPLFSREATEASASIVLKVNGTLDPSQVRAIRHLVASAVRGLRPEWVSVVDETGKLLADGAGDKNAVTGAGADERKIAYENRLRKEVENDEDFSGGGKPTITLVEHERRRADAESVAHRNGFAAGQKQAEGEAARRTAQALALIADGFAKLDRALAGIEARVETEAVEVAVAVASKLAPKLIAREPFAEISALATECFKHLVKGPHVVVRVGLEIHGLAQEKLAAIAHARGFEGRLMVVSEPGLAAGDCRIEWAEGGVARDEAATLAVINDAVGRYVAARIGATLENSGGLNP